jgi:hypothetical protein
LTCTAAQPLSASTEAAPKAATNAELMQRFPEYENASELNLLTICLLTACYNNDIQPFSQQYHSKI